MGDGSNHRAVENVKYYIQIMENGTEMAQLRFLPDIFCKVIFSIILMREGQFSFNYFTSSSLVS